jgi:hypothetical protein
MARTALAGTDPEKKNQTWAPSPDRERSTAGHSPFRRATSTYAATSSLHPPWSVTSEKAC